MIYFYYRIAGLCERDVAVVGCVLILRYNTVGMADCASKICGG